ncbi:MAG: bifunctional UDP-3-O-[3-hydroxymyristoyl] N-acetylglucosamine deacetylase/3-hydroxyacyl-ACP dehydratase [Flavobacteriales bacterium]|nr:bifunctional UDP-3-O-[3-hydroxymyristoyl] N-acetylglucosamine deacetylase/3-hydroxyacyl-ACP dehydratase [Flavobacteriales bacterium]
MKGNQNTIKKPVSISGAGLHTGKEVTLTFNPAKENHGIVFRRTDLEEKPLVHPSCRFVVDTHRGTTIEEKGVQVLTVEHVLAAIAGLEIDNLLIDINSEEPPICDGSAKEFLEALESVGIEDQEAPRDFYEITENIRYTDEKNGVEIIGMPADDFSITVMIDFDSLILRNQFAHMEQIDEFKSGFSRARTFSFLHELNMLLDAGRIKGGDLNNAIIYIDEQISEKDLKRLRKVFGRDDINVSQAGILNNLELEHPNEAARHKLLDVLGDLTLIGKPIKGRIIATRPGHTANTEFAKLLAAEIRMQDKKAPVVDFSAEPLYDVNKVMATLPHRPPFLLVDKIVELTDEYVIGVKNVTMNEPFFVGHFPGEPVMPGVLQIEAMAQVGGILVLNTVPDPENYTTYFMKIDQAKFKKKIVPGDTLVFKLKLITPIRRGIAHMFGRGYVGDAIAIEAEMMAQIVKNRN